MLNHLSAKAKLRNHPYKILISIRIIRCGHCITMDLISFVTLLLHESFRFYHQSILSKKKSKKLQKKNGNKNQVIQKFTKAFPLNTFRFVDTALLDRQRRIENKA